MTKGAAELAVTPEPAQMKDIVYILSDRIFLELDQRETDLLYL